MNSTTRTYSVIDLFAGPGGLAEGFSSVRNQDKDGAIARPFNTHLSIEKDQSAYETLLLRSFLRKFTPLPPQAYYDFLNSNGPEPDWASKYPEEWHAAQDEVLKHELDPKRADDNLNQKLDAIRDTSGDAIVLIGGPPCQPYSLVGRARNQGTPNYIAEDDLRHFLYQEYIRILQFVRPVAFVMENVKGLLSARVNGNQVFDLVIDDLRDSGYDLFPLAPRSVRSRMLTSELNRYEPADYVLRCEEFGIPQARHRVIVVGIRSDIAGYLQLDPAKSILRNGDVRATVKDVLSEMPKLRSGLSTGSDTAELWSAKVREALATISSLVPSDVNEAGAKSYREKIDHYVQLIKDSKLPDIRSAGAPFELPETCPPDLRNWIHREGVTFLGNNESRSHMPDDLARYLYAAIYAEAIGESPKSANFPVELSPKHRNWSTGVFADRFRVQLWDRPSTTITSHISKDGHYFIHPDPLQCRSLTVREAARLQTFPDDYYFRGNRTQQYVQVGNAVPPYLAMQIGKALYVLLESAFGNQAAAAVQDQAA